MKRRVKQAVLLLWLTLMGWSGLRAQAPDVVTLTPTDDPLAILPLDGALSMFIDSVPNHTFLNVPATAFSPVGRTVPNAGYTSEKTLARPIWLRFRVQNLTNESLPLLVQLNFWCFESSQLFVTRTDPCCRPVAGACFGLVSAGLAYARGRAARA